MPIKDLYLRSDRTARETLVNSADEDEIWFLVYERVCQENPEFGNAIFPIGLPEETIASHPLRLQMPPWGSCEGPTIAALCRKIIQAGEAVIREEIDAQIPVLDKGLSSEGTVPEGEG